MIFADGDHVRASFTIEGRIFRSEGGFAVIYTAEGYSRKIPTDSLTLLNDDGQPVACDCFPSLTRQIIGHDSECPAFRG